jgi:CHASE2 domain-containing sensor protein
VTIVPLNIEFLAPLEIALKEFEYSDVVISQIGMDRNLRIDTGIVLVNVGKAGRSQIADIIAAVDEAKPLAIGLDIMFMPNGDTAGTSHLCEVVRQAKARIVVAEVLTHDLQKTSDYVGIERGIFGKSNHVVFGFVNLPGSSTYRTVRRWQRSATIGEQHEQSFALALLNAGAKVNASEWTTDGLENLCYQRQKTWFVVEGNDILCNSQKRQVLAGRRILIGYLGDVLGDTSRIEDRFFTPLNASYVGRSTPDMYGLEIHATALSMLLHGHRLQNIHPLFDALVAFIIALIIISFNRRFVTNMRSFGEFVTRLIQVVILSGVFSAMAYMLLEVDVLVPIDISVACSLLCLDIATIYDGTALTLYRSVKSASRRTRLTYRQYQRRRTNRQDHYQ